VIAAAQTFMKDCTCQEARSEKDQGRLDHYGPSCTPARYCVAAYVLACVWQGITGRKLQVEIDAVSQVRCLLNGRPRAEAIRREYRMFGALR
jgi:hypothetical protein